MKTLQEIEIEVICGAGVCVCFNPVVGVVSAHVGSQERCIQSCCNGHIGVLGWSYTFAGTVAPFVGEAFRDVVRASC